LFFREQAALRLHTASFAALEHLPRLEALLELLRSHLHGLESTPTRSSVLSCCSRLLGPLSWSVFSRNFRLRHISRRTSQSLLKDLRSSLNDFSEEDWYFLPCFVLAFNLFG
jgi:hypothetical protein